MHVREYGRAGVEAEAQCLGSTVSAAQEDLTPEGDARNLALAPRNRGGLNDVFVQDALPSIA
jgi:hypothetical protein